MFYEHKNGAFIGPHEGFTAPILKPGEVKNCFTIIKIKRGGRYAPTPHIVLN